MKTLIARIALVTLLAAPSCSLISAFLQVNHSGAALVIVFSFPVNGEDQDDPNDTEDIGKDGIIPVHENFTPVLLTADLNRTDSKRNPLFRNHHQEIVTPPPEA